MRNLTESNLTRAVLQTMSRAKDPRLKTILTVLIQHLHAFVREVELTGAEWFEAMQFLYRCGEISSPDRQEFILLSDTLGVSTLVDAINHRRPEGATENSVLGPFYREGVPVLENGASIAGPLQGVAVFFEGRVRTLEGSPIHGALLDVWQTAPNGLYDVQDQSQPEMNLRGKFHTDEEGSYRFRTLPPRAYKIPEDGPVGDMLDAVNRSPWRPAHVHFKVSAPGYDPVITMIFTEGDVYLDSDAVFGVKDSLVATYVRHDSPAEAAERECTVPFYTVQSDFILKPSV